MKGLFTYILGSTCVSVLVRSKRGTMRFWIVNIYYTETVSGSYGLWAIYEWAGIF